MFRIMALLFAAGVSVMTSPVLADRLSIELKAGANEVLTDDSLPASEIQAAEDNPPCGKPPNTVEDIAKSVIGLGNISVGVPLLEASKYVKVDTSLLNSLRALTGTLNGKASCEQLCIELPLNAINVDVDGFIKGPKDANWVKLEFFVTGTVKNALMERPKFTKAANGYLICALAKNWQHDEARSFRLKITYDKK
ncbi:exported hypothetical protein [Azospirillaceae bacterium]